MSLSDSILLISREEAEPSTVAAASARLCRGLGVVLAAATEAEAAAAAAAAAGTADSSFGATAGTAAFFFMTVGAVAAASFGSSSSESVGSATSFGASGASRPSCRLVAAPIAWDARSCPEWIISAPCVSRATSDSVTSFDGQISVNHPLRIARKDTLP